MKKKIKKVIKKVKKPVTKTVHKKGALTKKLIKKIKPFIGVPSVFVETKKIPIHDADYWLNRPLDDKHLDWDYSGNWIEGYWQSFDHPHRQLILDALKEFEPFNLLELGCSCGPNLNLIRRNYGTSVNLAGIDVDERLIEMAKDKLKDMDLRVGNITKLPWDTQSFDCVLADAILMYLNKDDLKLVLDEVERVARKGVIIVDRFDKLPEGLRNGNVWAYNHQKLLENRGFKVKSIKIKKEHWPNSIGWIKCGYMWIATK